MSSEALSILVAILCIVFSLTLIGTLVGRYVYKRMHGLPTGDCEACHINTKKLLKKYHKKHQI